MIWFKFYNISEFKPYHENFIDHLNDYLVTDAIIITGIYFDYIPGIKFVTLLKSQNYFQKP